MKSHHDIVVNEKKGPTRTPESSLNRYLTLNGRETLPVFWWNIIRPTLCASANRILRDDTIIDLCRDPEGMAFQGIANAENELAISSSQNRSQN